MNVNVEIYTEIMNIRVREWENAKEKENETEPNKLNKIHEKKYLHMFAVIVLIYFQVFLSVLFL